MRRTHEATRSRAGQLDRVTLELRAGLARRLALVLPLRTSSYRVSGSRGPAGPNRSSHQQPIRGAGGIHGPSIPVTNAIESMIAICRDHAANVKRWRDGQMVLRWVAAGMGEAARQVRRVSGYLRLPPCGPPWMPPPAHRAATKFHGGRDILGRRPSGRLRVGSAARSRSWHTA
jgi:hypothetical protein